MLARFMGRNPDLLTEAEAAEFVRVTPRHFRKMVRDGWLLPVYPEGPRGPAMYRRSEAAGFLAAKEERLDLARTAHFAMQGHALARSLHHRVEDICTFLGLDTTYMADEEDEILATYLTAKEELDTGLGEVTLLTLRDWTHRVRRVDDNFLRLLVLHTGDPDAWQVLLEYTRQLLLQSPDLKEFGDRARWQRALALLSAVRRELVYWVYLHVRQVSGKRAADAAIPLDWDDSVLSHLMSGH